MYWFNRFTEHWLVPQRLDLVEHVRRGRVQVVQTGTLGPQFYSNAEDPDVDRHWVGMPFLGIRANLEYAAELIPRLQEAGARVVGQMSMAWHYGDHEQGKGLFGVWPRLWDEYLPEEAPCPDAVDTQQLSREGVVRRWPIEGRPYYAYSGCMCNPHWLATLRAMLDVALDLGIDGVNVHHNFENFCACAHCRLKQQRWLSTSFDEAERAALFGRAEMAELTRFEPREDAPEGLRQRLEHELHRATQYRRKAAFDEIFIAHGRSRKPDLLLAQWYHKYDFGPGSERSLLPPDLWARGEDYIWYSQGGHLALSRLAQGWLGDVGLPARFLHAAADGRPFICNKYDVRRWRLSIAEAAAHHFAGPAYHWVQDDDADFALEDYTGPVFRYQAFLADHEALIHPAQPWSQIGLVYPRRGELAEDEHCNEASRRLGRLMEDAHLPFDMLLDHQIEERLGSGSDSDGYGLLILPDVTRLSDGEVAALQAFVEGGGRLLCTGSTGALDEAGRARDAPALAAAEGIARIERVPLITDTFEVAPGDKRPRVPELADDPFGQVFMGEVEGLLGGSWLATDAPWYVRVRAWRPKSEDVLVLHWVNYRQDEAAAIEVPWPVGPLQVRCRIPAGHRVDRVEWLYPEMSAPTTLEHTRRDKAIEFAIPQLIVYGLSVLHLAPA